jgi:hypothetical protein
MLVGRDRCQNGGTVRGYQPRFAYLATPVMVQDANDQPACLCITALEVNVLNCRDEGIASTT